MGGSRRSASSRCAVRGHASQVREDHHGGWWTPYRHRDRPPRPPAAPHRTPAAPSYATTPLLSFPTAPSSPPARLPTTTSCGSWVGTCGASRGTACPRSLSKWWVVPPIVALLLILGCSRCRAPPLPRRTRARPRCPRRPPASPPRPNARPRCRARRTSGRSDTLLGVLVLGVAGVFGLRAARRRAPGRRHDDRHLAAIAAARPALDAARSSSTTAPPVGESDKGIVLLEAGRSSTRANRRTHGAGHRRGDARHRRGRDEGAVPRTC